jgi:hypothetical protein
MSGIRRLIARLAAAWLLTYACMTVGTTVVFSATAGAHDMKCTCGHESDHAACPMHHGKSDASRCRMQSTQTRGDAAFVSLFGAVGIPPQSVTVSDAAPMNSTITEASAQPRALIVPPDPPPPRS